MPKIIRNGITYGGSGTITALDNYSTKEQVVGTWIDGKPLYQKTLYTDTLPSTGTAFELADLSSLNLDKIVSANGILVHKDLKQFVVLGNYNPNDNGIYSVSLLPVTRAGYDDQTPIILIRSGSTGNPFTAFKECFVTIQYTKTTD